MSHIDILDGKKWWACGDSFTEWGTEEYEKGELPNLDGLRYFKSYPYFIAKRNPGLTVFNDGLSGRTMAYPPEHDYDNAFSNEYYKQIPDDVDYITLYFGINDSHHRPCYRGIKPGIIELGTIDDTTTDTFYGAWNVILEYLIEHHPYAHIGIIISNDCETVEYPEAEVRLARKWGIPYLDLNGGYQVPLMQHVTGKSEVCERAIELRKQAFYADPANNNPHTNTKAQEYQSSFIETWLRTL